MFNIVVGAVGVWIFNFVLNAESSATILMIEHGTLLALFDVGRQFEHGVKAGLLIFYF